MSELEKALIKERHEMLDKLDGAITWVRYSTKYSVAKQEVVEKLIEVEDYIRRLC